MAHHFLILGGYGNAGRPIAEYLLMESEASLVIAGRNLQKAENCASMLNREFPGNRVGALEVDARDSNRLKEALKGIDMVIVASSTANFAESIALAVLESGTDYMDIQLSHDKIRILKSLEERIAGSGRCFITDGGYHPGIPAAMVRHAANQMDTIDKAVVGAIMNINWKGYSFSPETISEFSQELKMGSPLIFREGSWQKARWGGMAETLRMDFGPDYGKKELFPLFLEEMRVLPGALPGLKETGFYIGGMDWFSNWISFPLASMWFQLFPGSNPSWIPGMLFWGMRNFSKPPFYTRIRLESSGKLAGKPVEYSMELSHPDGYLFTAIPVVACLRQYLAGEIKKPGLYTQGELVDPEVFFSDIKRMGIEVTENQ
jgi:saccharopine dehydrogenase-like NADP-dependent oxidoreductase